MFEAHKSGVQIPEIATANLDNVFRSPRNIVFTDTINWFQKNVAGLTPSNAGENVEQRGIFIHCWWECKMVQPLWKTVWQLLTELNILLPYDPAIMFLGIYPKELKIYVHTKTCTQMFVAALFIIAKTWKQPRCPSVGRWINCGTSRQ